MTDLRHVCRSTYNNMVGRSPAKCLSEETIATWFRGPEFRSYHV